MEDEEALETSELVCKLPDVVEDKVDDLLADGVVATGVVVGGVLLAGDELLGVEELPVGAGPDLVDDCRLQVHKDSPGDVLASTGFGEEGREAVVNRLAGVAHGQLAVGLDAVLHAVQLPAGVAHLDSGLADMDRDTFPHGDVELVAGFWK